MDSTNNIISKVLYGYDSSSISFLFEGNFSNKEKISIFLDNKEIDKLDIFYTKSYIKIKVLRDNVFEQKIDFKFTIKKDNTTIQTFPVYSDFFIDIENLELKKWYV